ncbi:hypothetical protein BGZ79_011047 [Entomortierella chlamydospora]|nr:hypothetical protein BGZ79_011047 [Entomortierella chlamydospora]
MPMLSDIYPHFYFYTFSKYILQLEHTANMFFNLTNIARLYACYVFCTFAAIASPLSVIPGGPNLGGPNPGGPILGGPILGGLGSPGSIIGPTTFATTQSNVIANTDVAPQVDVAPTIPILCSDPYSVPVPVASGYPYPVPADSCGQWGSGGAFGNCGGFGSGFAFSQQPHGSEFCDFGDLDSLWGSGNFGSFGKFGGC